MEMLLYSALLLTIVDALLSLRYGRCLVPGLKCPACRQREQLERSIREAS